MHPQAAAQTLLESRVPPAMGIFIGVSVGLHVAVLGVGLLLAGIDRGTKIDLDQKPIKATLVRLGKERDERLLPRQETPPPPKQVVAPPKPPPPVPAVDKPVPAPVPALEPAPAAVPQPGEKVSEAKKPSLADAFGKASLKPQELEGAADGDPFGDSALQEGERYYGALRAQVRRYYDVSRTIADPDRVHLRAEVLIRIGRSGELLDARLAKASGNDLFDSAVLSAAKKASPFSPPPDHLRNNLESRGILLEFRP